MPPSEDVTAFRARRDQKVRSLDTTLMMELRHSQSRRSIL